LASAVPRLRIHGHFGQAPSNYLEMVARMGLETDIDWLGDLSNKEIAALYRRSQLCVLPYTASFAGLPAGFAASNRLPVVATGFAGIPDHIGDLAIAIDANDPAQLSDVLQKALSDAELRVDLGKRLRAHAEQHLGWATIAGATLAVYRAARERAAARTGADPRAAVGA
jgi:glycogen(starch) synthase